ncbi:MAG: cytochrome P460 family protein [Pseudomonadales bacterium]
MRKLNLTLLAVVAATFGPNAISDNASVDYPTGYRTWQHVKSMIIQPGHALEDPFGGIHHIYANAKAMSGLSSGQYEDGAVFVFDLLDYDDSNKTIVEKERKRIDLMQYDSEQFAETGGWGYDTFVGDSTTERLDQDVVASCFGCHTSAKASNYVFSQYRP